MKRSRRELFGHMFNSLLLHILILGILSVLLSTLHTIGNVDQKISAVQLILIIFMVGYVVHWMQRLEIHKNTQIRPNKIYWFINEFGLAIAFAIVEIVFYVFVSINSNFVVYYSGIHVFLGMAFGQISYFYIQFSVDAPHKHSSRYINAKLLKKHTKFISLFFIIGLLLFLAIFVNSCCAVPLFISSILAIFVGAAHCLLLIINHRTYFRKSIFVILSLLICYLIILYVIIIYIEAYSENSIL